MARHHFSDCALNSGPARSPQKCDCPTGDRQPGSSSCREGYSPVVGLRSFAELWSVRIAFLRENLGSLDHYRRTIATRLGLGRRPYRNPEDAAPPS